MDIPSITSALLLAVAFFPLALTVALQVLPILRPPQHRPRTFLWAGIFLVMLGSLSAYGLWSVIISGVLNYRSRRLGMVHIEAANSPIEFWSWVLVFYTFSLCLAGLGFAGIGLRFKRSAR